MNKSLETLARQEDAAIRRAEAMNDTKHTPTPWQARSVRHDLGRYEIGSVDLNGAGDYAALAYSAADAAHIVRCVNAHDELVAALRDLCDATDRPPLPSVLANAYDNARAALAKVSP
jgi:hypothetical protein